MRFFTFVAFMLPLSALAAPTPTPPQPSPDDLIKQVTDARDRFAAAIKETSTALNNTIDLLQNDSKRGALLKKANDANTNLGIAFTAALSIDADVRAGNAPQESDQLKVAQGTIGTQTILKDLDKKVNKIKDKNGKIDLKKLQSDVRDALIGANKMVQAGVDVLALQGKSVRQLFENAGLEVPPGF